MPKSSFAKLVVYDILGRELETIVNPEYSRLNAGTYEVDFPAFREGTNYPSGVYYYKLIAGKFSQTNKMVLMK